MKPGDVVALLFSAAVVALVVTALAANVNIGG